MLPTASYTQVTCDSLLSAFYDFQGDVLDQTGHGHHGILTGAATVENVLNIPADQQSAVVLPNELLHEVMDFTVACRVKFHAFQVSGADPINIIINGFSDNNAFVIGYRKLANIVHLTFGGIGTDVPLNTQLVENQWYCFVFTRSDGFGKIYIDGEIVGSAIPIENSPLEIDALVLGQDQDCLAGCFASNQSLNGQLDNLRIFQRVLSDEEVGSFCQTSSIKATICEGEKYEGYEQAGEFTDFFETATACDSMRVLQLQVNPTLDSSFTKHICENETFLGFQETGQYRIVMQNQFGCDSILNVNLVVSQKIYAPNSFSPNANGINDTFLLFGPTSETIILKLQIFDRWGEMVFEAENVLPSDQTVGWDGTFNEKDAQIGIYAWMALVRFPCGETNLLKGDLTLFR
ncbi:MAG: gliding motility-associated C-terminal domain-containing protein [Saprospiraceae bacterium]|nr:gliding motility-associated C-terminal domain-containing protein [Saprospiraceae bacterium]MCF8282180.1 gliding motility-associated C-terminal domain-containing protein [Bacteroidales bacterium]